MAEGGKIKLLGVLAPKRVSYIPSVPTAEEQGVIKGVSVSWWAGISMPAATPDAIVRKWEAALAEMVKDPAFRAAADRMWMNLDYLNAAERRPSSRSRLSITRTWQARSASGSSRVGTPTTPAYCGESSMTE